MVTCHSVISLLVTIAELLALFLPFFLFPLSYCICFCLALAFSLKEISPACKGCYTLSLKSPQKATGNLQAFLPLLCAGSTTSQWGSPLCEKGLVFEGWIVLADI